MRSLIDRITNRDLVEGLRTDLEESDQVVGVLKEKLVDTMGVMGDQELELIELRDKADKLVNVINVLKMRFDLLVPVAPLVKDVKKDESEQRPPVR